MRLWDILAITICVAVHIASLTAATSLHVGIFFLSTISASPAWAHIPRKCLHSSSVTSRVLGVSMRKIICLASHFSIHTNVYDIINCVTQMQSGIGTASSPICHDLLPVLFVLQHEQFYVVAQGIPVFYCTGCASLPYMYHRLWESTIAMNLMRSCIRVQLAFVFIEMLLNSTSHFGKQSIRAIP